MNPVGRTRSSSSSNLSEESKRLLISAFLAGHTTRGTDAQAAAAAFRIESKPFTISRMLEIDRAVFRTISVDGSMLFAISELVSAGLLRWRSLSQPFPITLATQLVCLVPK
jgi:hypothetical protein